MKVWHKGWCFTWCPCMGRWHWGQRTRGPRSCPRCSGLFCGHVVLGVKLPGQATSLPPLPELWVSSSCFRAVSLGENINLSGGRSPQQEYRNRSIYFRELLRAWNRTTYTVGPHSDLCSNGPSSERRTQSALPPKAVTPLLSLQCFSSKFLFSAKTICLFIACLPF